MKKFLPLIFLSIFILTGCEFALDKASAVVFFSSSLITKETFKPDIIEENFKTGELINYCIYAKEPFGTSEGRIQIIKKEPKARVLGYSLYQANDIILNPSKNSYTGSFTVYSEGFYLLRVFTKNSPEQPIAQRTFWVEE